MGNSEGKIVLFTVSSSSAVINGINSASESMSPCKFKNVFSNSSLIIMLYKFTVLLPKCQLKYFFGNKFGFK
jgi:hypothetical protein